MQVLPMGLRLPLGMETLGSSRNEVLDEEGAPDSWEMADLEQSMKNLITSSKCSSGSHGEDCNTVEGEVNFLSVNASGAAKTVDGVDRFLREALQNPRDRLTILRLEQDVERFMRSPKQQQFEFQPMPSSYLRLAAHRVAQHYSLQSTVVDNGSVEGTRIIARKNAESRFPSIRLVDVPVDPPEDEKPVVLAMPKVAIKQRPGKGGRANGDGSGFAGGNRLNASKSVEERKEEYNKARARIFSKVVAGKVAEVEAVAALDDTRLVECYNLEDVSKVDEKYKGAGESPDVVSLQDYTLSDGKNREVFEKESFSRGKLNPGTSSRVAIFRDREKDRKDPDYDRNYDRYSQRFEPGFGMSIGGPFGVQAVYTPLVDYNTEFPQLAGPRPHMHMEPPPPPPIPQQRLQRPPWVTPGPGNISFRHPDPSMAPYTQGHIGTHSGMSMYMHAPQYAYQGPSLAYVQPHERFQQSISQLHPHQPDANLNNARRR